MIACDFDGTLCDEAWPEIGAAHWPIIHELIRRQAEGTRIILWTCREGELLENTVMWCLNHGIKFDAINSNVAERIEQYGDDPRKVSADEYWDDRSVLVSGGRRACRCLWQEKAGSAFRSGRKTRGSAKARSVFRAPQGGNSLLRAEPECYWMQTWEETTLTCAGQKGKSRFGVWIRGLWKRIFTGARCPCNDTPFVSLEADTSPEGGGKGGKRIATPACALVRNDRESGRP